MSSEAGPTSAANESAGAWPAAEVGEDEHGVRGAAVAGDLGAGERPEEQGREEQEGGAEQAAAQRERGQPLLTSFGL